MVRLAQYNPSTGLVSYNSTTGKQQVIKPSTAGSFCGLCGTNIGDLIVETSGISACCAQDVINGVGYGSRTIIGDWDSYLNDIIILTRAVTTSSQCSWEQKRDVRGAGLQYVYRYSPNNSCSGDPADIRDIEELSYYYQVLWNSTHANLSYTIRGTESYGSSSYLIIAQISSGSLSRALIDCVDEHWSDLYSFDDCTYKPVNSISSVPTETSSLIISVEEYV